MTYSKTLPLKNLTQYYSMLCTFFLKGNLFYNFINCAYKLYLMNKSDFCFDIYFYERINRILGYKKDKESVFFVGQSMRSGSDILEVFKRRYKEETLKEEESLKEDKENINFRFNFDFKFYDLYEDSLEKEIIADRKFISFLKINNFDYQIINGKVKVGKYEYKSMIKRVYEMRMEMESKQTKNKKIEEMKKLEEIRKIEDKKKMEENKKMELQEKKDKKKQ